MHDYDIPKAGVSDGDVVSASVLYAAILIGIFAFSIIHDSRATGRAAFVESPATEPGLGYVEEARAEWAGALRILTPIIR